MDIAFLKDKPEVLHPDDRFSGLRLGDNDWGELFVDALGVPDEPRAVVPGEPYFISAERVQKKFLETLTNLGFPLLGRFHDIFGDAYYTPEEVPGLLDECDTIKARFPPAEVPSAINKLLYACYEASKHGLGIQLSGD
jgi:hypothetical protein